MLTETQLQRIEENFRLAAAEFGFNFQRFFEMDNGVTAFGHISNYGSKNGTVIFLMSPPDFDTENKKQIAAWCESHQMFFSFLNADLLTGEYRRSYFREMLRDWGRFAPELI